MAVIQSHRTRSILAQAKSVLSIHDEADPTRVVGMDTSHYSGVVDMQKAKAAGIKFVIVKMLNGINEVQYFKENYRGAIDAGLVVGAYQWLYPAARFDRNGKQISPGVSPGGQARKYAEMLRDYPVNKNMAYVDYEWTEPATPNAGDLQSFVDPFQDAYGALIGIYSAPGYINEFGVPSKYAQNPFWIAQYGVKQPDSVKPWNTDWKLHQFTAIGDGAKYGFPKNGEQNIDLNYWVGDLESFYRWVGATVSPTPTPVPTPPSGGTVTTRKKITITWPAGARERASNSTGSTGYNILPVGSVVYSQKEVVADYDNPANADRRWIQLEDGNYIAVKYDIVRATVEDIDSTPTPTPTPTPVPSDNEIVLDVHATVNGQVYEANGITLIKKT